MKQSVKILYSATLDILTVLKINLFARLISENYTL